MPSSQRCLGSEVRPHRAELLRPGWLPSSFFFDFPHFGSLESKEGLLDKAELGDCMVTGSVDDKNNGDADGSRRDDNGVCRHEPDARRPTLNLLSRQLKGL